ncbi:MAG: AAA family ATPase [Treponema sp.]|nr:AAA family ATPase [Treponema sp.]
MATLHNLKIKNFRGILNFEQTFKQGLTCIIGRGDSGKSTIIDAIACVLSSSWSINFYDSDFCNCQIENPIEIEATLKNIPDKLLTKFGMYVRGIKDDGTIIDDMESDAAHDAELAISIRLTVTKELEPTWEVVSYRGQEPVNISASYRAKLKAFTISDYSDRHFSLNKGNPLYTLLKGLENEIDNEENTILEMLREAKGNIDSVISSKFESVIKKVKEESSNLGVPTNDLLATIDHRDISIKENKVCLHEENIPLRLKGKGSKRIISLAIQIAVANPNGIILIDEIEQGLEPDRVQHLVSILKAYTNFQIFFTTHSSNVIVELAASDLFIMREDETKFLPVPEELQGCIRKNPEALFAKKIIVCEGATEVGMCRALNAYMQSVGKKSLTYCGVRLADGAGSNMIQYAEDFKALGFDVCLFCDSDVSEINDKKNQLNDIKVIDCQDGYAIEQQLFADLSWDSVVKMVDYRREFDGIENQAIFDSIYSVSTTKPAYTENWYTNESDDVRTQFGNKAKDKDWYKRIDHGEKIGEIVFDEFNVLGDDKKIKLIFQKLIEWVEK